MGRPCGENAGGVCSVLGIVPGSTYECLNELRLPSASLPSLGSPSPSILSFSLLFYTSAPLYSFASTYPIPTLPLSTSLSPSTLPLPFPPSLPLPTDFRYDSPTLSYDLALCLIVTTPTFLHLIVTTPSLPLTYYSSHQVEGKHCLSLFTHLE